MRKLTVRQSINTIFLKELKEIVYDHRGAAYVKFILIAIGIEYLGACLDSFDFNDDRQSEKRFNNALTKLFPRKYTKHAKSDAEFYLYKKFRCSFVHQLRPGKNVAVTHRRESNREGTKHLNKTKSGKFVLVLEDFFDDFEKACNTLFKLEEKGKLPSRKLDQDYINLRDVRDNM